MEEINALVLGDWPKKGCLIVSTWEEEFGKTYTWQGSVEKTSELHQKMFTQARSLFSIQKEDKFGEKKFVKSVFHSLDGANWLKDPYRLNNIRLIKDSFLFLTRESKIFSKEKNLNYIDIVMYGRTSVKNYHTLKAKQALLFKKIKFNFSGK